MNEYASLEDMQAIARTIERGNPKWIVLYGAYTRQFIAMPKFEAPDGTTIITSYYPPALHSRMREIEASYAQVNARS